MGDEISDVALRKQIKKDLLAFDFLFSLFVAALSSYRHDTVLRPFPPPYIVRDVFVDDGLGSKFEKDFDGLKKDVAKIKKMKSYLNREGQLDVKILKLLSWIFNSKKFIIKSCDMQVFSEIREKACYTFETSPPTYIFSVEHSALSNERFETLRNNRNVFYGYHGSKLENFHSILHFGLKANLNKNSLFGNGSYLSSELSVSLDYSPYGHGWPSSCMGSRLSCVAVCEIIDDPSVKCKTQTEDKSRSHIDGSIGGEIPEKYYIVTDDEFVRVKYLLVYASRDKYLKLVN
ncbi:hypothetical protein HELRODRAFT_67096 [Helobdella robusta]|uniref:Poly [ADP-ribose] polymerase n=1 Tax=Helobdella robusta TaxID=6412 RepID=T1FYW2_HELRO|nr:hypothetical protein HELRODRAFT_67096 [Helobdella robusta]ESN98639.1 hypothetical protein HELRODRAFT_67096 [Helobdella robusta]